MRKILMGRKIIKVLLLSVCFSGYIQESYATVLVCCGHNKHGVAACGNSPDGGMTFNGDCWRDHNPKKEADCPLHKCPSDKRISCFSL